MKKFILIAFILLSIDATAQNVTVDNKGNYIALTASKDSGTLSSKTYTDSKGVVYPVYITGKGKAFVMKISKKTSKEYKMYLVTTPKTIKP